MPEYAVVCFSIPKYAAVYSSMLQYSEVCFSMLQYPTHILKEYVRDNMECSNG